VDALGRPIHVAEDAASHGTVLIATTFPAGSSKWAGYVSVTIRPRECHCRGETIMLDAATWVLLVRVVSRRRALAPKQKGGTRGR